MSRTGDTRYRRNRARLKAERKPCHWCGQAIDYLAAPNTPASFEADHLVSLQSGGSNHGELVAAHSSCNRSRGRAEQTARGRVIKYPTITRSLSEWL